MYQFPVHLSGGTFGRQFRDEGEAHHPDVLTLRYVVGI
jgi:hypothetical protein